MNNHVDARIFLTDGHGRTQTATQRSYHVFATDHYVADGRAPVGALYRLSDDTLAPGASLSVTAKQRSGVVLLPLIGGLEYRREQAGGFLAAGQVGVLPVPAGSRYVVANPFETETVRWLQLSFATPLPPANAATAPTRRSATTLKLNEVDLSTKNVLRPVAELDANRVSIGCFDGRAEGTYDVVAAHGGASTPGVATPGVFVYVIQGVFEVANRLLHAGDGLSLRYSAPDVVAFEALSNDAILLLIELPLEGAPATT